jgi:hypothetical protein
LLTIGERILRVVVGNIVYYKIFVLIVGIKSGFLFDSLEQFGLFKKIYCESTDDMNNINNNIKGNRNDKINDDIKYNYNFSNAKNVANNANNNYSIGGEQSLVVGPNSTVSNISNSTVKPTGESSTNANDFSANILYRR